MNLRQNILLVYLHVKNIFIYFVLTKTEHLTSNKQISPSRTRLTGNQMKESIIESKWTALIPERSNGYAHVETEDGIEVCTVYAVSGALITADKIASDHNAMLRASKKLKNTKA